MLEIRLHGEDLPDRAGLQQFLRADVRAHEPLVVPEHQDVPGAALYVDHALRLLHGGRHRLFAEHVLARLERFDRMCAVQEVRRADAHRLHALVAEHFLKAAVYRAAVLLGELLGTRAVPVVKADDLGVRVRAVFRRVARAGDLPAARDRHADLFHCFCRHASHLTGLMFRLTPRSSSPSTIVQLLPG